MLSHQVEQRRIDIKFFVFAAYILRAICSPFSLVAVSTMEWDSILIDSPAIDWAFNIRAWYSSDRSRALVFINVFAEDPVPGAVGGLDDCATISCKSRTADASFSIRSEISTNSTVR